MKDDHQTKKQLVRELTELRSQNAALKKTIVESLPAGPAAEEARRYAESIVDTVREPLLVLDADLKIISANRNFYRSFKATPGETLGRLIYDLGNRQWDIPRLRELLEQVLSEKEAFDDFEVAHDFQDIGHKIMLFNARRIFRKEIDAKLILLAIEDVTERKRIEEKICYQAVLLANVNDAVVASDEHYRLTVWNAVAESLYGWKADEVLGRSGLGIVQTDYLGADKGQMLNAIATAGRWRGEATQVRKDGTRIPVEVSSIVLHDENGRISGYVSVNRDITERKRAAEALRNSETQFREMFDDAPVGYHELDNEGRFTRVNRTELAMLGYAAEEMLGRHVWEFVDEKEISRKAVLDKLAGILPPGKNLERNYCKKDGTRMPVLIQDLFLRDKDGKVTGIRTTLQDMTYRKLADKQLQDTVESLRKSFRTTVQVLVSAVESRDPYTAGHQIRSANLARAMAAEMGLSQERVDGIRLAGSIHDIGKLSIPAEILSKPTKLSELEFRMIQEHSLQGYEILKDVESPWPLAEIVHQHHERMDGSGYPRHLKGEEILMEARILAIADVVESMASHRPYRAALGLKAGMEEIENNKGILYDADAVDACLRLFREKGFQFEGA